MGCHICGKRPIQAAKCPACGHIAAYLCDGMMCQPSLWRMGPNEKPSSVPLMNFACEKCGTELELEPLPAPFDTTLEPGKLFGFIGTYLLHCYGDEVVDGGAGYEFAIAHFLNTMAPETKGWAFLVNGALDNPKTHGNRPLTAMIAKHSQTMAQKQTIAKAKEWVTSSLKGVVPFRMSALIESFYTSAMVLSGSLATCELVPDEGAPEALVGQGNYSSRSTKPQIDGVVDYMRDPKIQKAIGWPTFSVWDCNCFHNSGYIMGKYALDTALALSGEEGSPVLIVNIDQHSDAGGDNQTIISSDRWGRALVECFPNCAYLSVASAGKSVSHQIETHFRAGTGRVSTLRGAGVPLDKKFTNTHLDHLFNGNALEKKAARDRLKAYWPFLLTKIYPDESTRPASFRFAYLTIDRDCMQGNLNQWGDVKAILETHEQVATLVDAILGTLVSTGCRVVGFDVTGLPEDHAKLKCNQSKGEKTSASAVLNGVKDELAAFQDVFDRHIVTR